MFMVSVKHKGGFLSGLIFGLMVALCSLSCSRKEQTASMLNVKALSYIWIDLDSTEQFASLAYDMTRRHSDERALSMNIMARVASSRLDYRRAWELYSAIPEVTGNQLERLTAKVGMMRICQRISDNVSYYEYRNDILLMLRLLHEESVTFNEEQYGRMLSLERSFRMESARYWSELEQPAQAEYEMSYVRQDNGLRDDSDRFQMYMYMRGLGIGGNPDDPDEVGQRLRSLDNCLRNSMRDGNTRMYALSIGAIAGLLLEYGTETVLSGVSGEMLSRLNASDVSAELLPTQLALKSLQLSAQYGSQYDIIVCERLLASCYIERGLYEDALGTLSKALGLLNDNLRLNYPEADGLERLEFYRDDGVIVEEDWMREAPLAALPELMSTIREQISLAFSGLDDKAVSDYNRNVYLELQKNIRLDRRFEARSMLLERSNNRLTALLLVIVGTILLLLLALAVFHKRIKAYRERYAELMRRTVSICEEILHPVPEGSDIHEYLDSTVSGSIREITGAQAVTITADGLVDADWGDSKPDRNTKAVIKTVTPFIKVALRNADELTGQENRLRQVEKQQYVYRMHADRNKRENIARKTCCQVVAECLPYIDRMRAEIGHLTQLSPESGQYDRSLEYIRELAGCINDYNDVLASWINVRQGMVKLNVESFPLQQLFDIVGHGSRSFTLKGLELDVRKTEATVRADRVLTLFMLNTLADNARKFTPSGGKVSIGAVEENDWVEVSVQDSGIGLSAEDVRRINEEKVYDPESIGSADARRNKGSGFGIMNCRGIIEKYRKSDEIFSVCRFSVESTPGKGSRFSFRLPKGVRRVLGLLLALVWTVPALSVTTTVDYTSDSLIVKAYNYAYQTYLCNTEMRFEEALVYADSALASLNEDYIANGGNPQLTLKFLGSGTPSETYWIESGFATDYETVLWIRNEVAVSALALKEWAVYRYNDDAYLKLFKLFYSEDRIEKDCLELQRYNSNLTIAVIVLVILLLIMLLMRFMMRSRHWLRYRSDLQQVVRVVNSISETTSVRDTDNFNINEVLQRVADGMSGEMDHLYDLRELTISIIDEGKVCSARAASRSHDERLSDRVRECIGSGTPQSTSDGLCQALPLLLETDGSTQFSGALGIRLEHEPDETWRVVTDMVTHYLATALNSCVMRFQTGFRNLEQMQEESDRIRFEDNRLHVSNLVLDNCLSTLKHETVWYPNRIMQMAQGDVNASEMLELVDYYREIYGILSQYALSQTKEHLLHAERVDVDQLMADTRTFFGKHTSRKGINADIEYTDNGLAVKGDGGMLRYLLECLVEDASEGERIALEASVEGDFVRISVHRNGEMFSGADTDLLFSPLRNRESMSYVICRQIIREHDELFGYPGCRINAERVPDGVIIWFTMPLWK